MGKQKRLGFYRKTSKSNKRLIELFEKNQKARYDGDWEDKDFVKKLTKEEKQARKEILKMLEKGQIRTPDDFYRAAWFLHHGKDSRSHGLAVALAAASGHLSESWGKNLYAVALDRFLISIGQPQHFGTQLEKRRGKWILSPYNKRTTDKERKLYFVDPIQKTIKKIEKLNLEEKINET